MAFRVRKEGRTVSPKLNATPHAQYKRGKVIGVGIYVCGQKKLNRTLAIDSPFQTFAVRLLVEFID